MKTLLFYIAAILSLAFFSSCKKEMDNDLSPLYGTVQQSVKIRIEDSTGKDLLNPSNPDALKTFKIYYLENGQHKLYNQPNMDSPGGYTIKKVESDGYYYVQVLLDAPHKESLETLTYLEFEDTTVSEIKTRYLDVDNAIIIDKIWYDDLQMWERSGGDRIFQITKP